MRLSTLEIKGFKSFGDKVTIHFDKGVTSIVGPNGSGKSNVVDAMRWVLGEQKTRMLRSEKMENIIFNGTKNRKQANLAEVSLTFENTKNILPTEYSTVTITRKLYRDGESEYQLNGVSCRLKDITDLFLDTGIGPDSYSIIELKMIDEIINDRTNTIRTLFEEAAGISKYKIRKKHTFQKLEETELDLNRVNDLLFEIEKNLKALESQAKKTERYYKLKEQYKELSTELAIFTIASYKETFETLQQQEAGLKDEKTAAEAELDKAEAALQKQKLDTLEQEKHLAASQKLLNEKLTFIRQKESDKKVKNERLKFLQDKEQSLTNQVFSDKKLLDELSEGQKNLELTFEQESAMLATAEKQLNEAKTELDKLKTLHAASQTEVSTYTKQIQHFQEELFKLEKQLAIQQTQREALNNEITRLQTEKNIRNEELDQLKEQLETIATQKEQQEELFGALVNTETEVQEKINGLDVKLKTTSEQVVITNRKLDAKHNEFNLLKSLVDNLEGFPESIKYLKKKANKTAPLLSDLVYCQPEYKLAIESFLEPYMNYFVVDDLDEAKQCINLLTEASQGRANFFILENYKNGKAKHADIQGCKPAIGIIEFDKKYENLIHGLLHNVYLVTEQQEEIPFNNDELTFITQNGKYLKTATTLGGGSVGLFEGKRIGRAKNLELLKADMDGLEQQKEASEKEIQQLESQLQQAKNDFLKNSASKASHQNELNRINTQYTTIKTRCEQSQQQLDQIEKRLSELNQQLNVDNAPAGSGDILDNINDIRYQKDELQSKLLDAQNQLNQLNIQLTELSGRHNQLNISFLQQQNKLSTTNREITFKRTQSDSIAQSIKSNTGELDKAKTQIAEILTTGDDSDDDMILLYEEKSFLETVVSELETAYYKARGESDETENNIRELRKKKENIDALTLSLRDKITELKFQLNSLKERLSVEFEVNIEDIMVREANPLLQEASLREQVDKLRGQIQNYGPINPLAIEAYNEIKERHTFIITQQEDLRKAKESLLQTISEIDNTAKEKFLESYNTIRANFINVFRSLFSEEDKCDLILVDSNNPLESEINIIAQPKGKRPLSINQLSGGEKTLTATALLFSIYLLKPAPFCIFDEVDAPLDDTNIDKFNNIIQKFSTESQFIIITHNKRTMAFTDIIYGVTMIEMGVTQVVPVDMREVA